ncbi:diphthine--ammonia ligase-like [Penaeus monodon]|uniref:diphthine--ammonia ligase-like n=1 Tax=Penaeus monodon TaxID=6687 RepID=UPI0018A7D243|nr:diphthine--ammonia ligase-like [Penaeus monodon]
MHVQGISHWAPANIGPYSQAVKVGSVVVVAGMIGLVPGTLQVVNGGVEVEARLALRHVSRVISAIAPSTDIRAVVQGVCYVTKLSDIGVARRMMARLSESQISTYVVVPALPRAALVEWQTWGCVENDKFEYEEKGYTRGNVSVRLRRRWYHDNSMCAVNTNASCLSPEDLSCDMLEEIIQYTITRADARMPMGLTFYYRCGSISRTLLQQAIVQAVPEGVATLSLVPVLAVEDAHTLLTVSAMRH